MSTEPSFALQALIARLEQHLAIVSQSRGAGEASIDEAFGALADAFEDYEEALYDQYSELLPFTIPSDDE
ncbi:hypothetical protein [Glutamicibacter arilaitensis]|uniref:Dehydrogenase n=1 Tax=Glutamicibacter arilaitensis TaxID=256701 RepID=A0A2N7S4C1_9MICC|nr:hypothetical protein [Glutamicibacter arilaitensis]PMQ20964.1 hypothetical protein CIK84_05090 [Glutamicibacter arilaitensis]